MTRFQLVGFWCLVKSDDDSRPALTCQCMCFLWPLSGNWSKATRFCCSWLHSNQYSYSVAELLLTFISCKDWWLWLGANNHWNTAASITSSNTEISPAPFHPASSIKTLLERQKTICASPNESIWKPACLLSTGSSMVRSKTLGMIKSCFAFPFAFAEKL